MKCFCCVVPIKIDIYELSNVQQYILNEKLNIPISSSTLLELVDFVNIHNSYVYYSVILKKTFNLRIHRKKKRYNKKINDYLDYFLKKYDILFQADGNEAYDYFDLISLWKLLKKQLF